MEIYPRTLMEFESQFSSEAACLDYLIGMRWPSGFICPSCKGQKAWRTGRVLFHCAGCGRQTSITAGTVFQGTRKPLLMWFRAMWWVTSQKNGASAKGLQQNLGLGSYQTAWTWLHSRKSKSRGKLFYRLVEQALAIDHTPYKAIVNAKPLPVVAT